MDLDWDNPVAEEIRIGLTLIDEFKLPFERRGYSIKFPRTEAEIDKLADEMGEMVKKTVIFMINEQREARK